MALIIGVTGDSNSEPGGANCGGAANVWAYKLRAALATAYPSQTFTLQNYAIGGSWTDHWLPANSGSNIGGITCNLNALLATHPDVLFLPSLTNDYGQTTLAHVTDNLRAIIAACLANTVSTNPTGHTIPILRQPPVAAPMTQNTGNGTAYPAGTYTYGRPRVNTGAMQGLTEMSAAVSALGAELGIPVVTGRDSYIAEYSWGNTDSNTATAGIGDGVHYNATGQAREAVWAQAVMATMLDASGSILGAASLTATAATDHTSLSWTGLGAGTVLVERRVAG